MNPYLLDVAYAGGFLAASPYFLYKMATTGKYRAGLSQRLGFVPERTGAECIWLHGVSVGELLAARSIVAGLRKALPDVPLAVSTTTNTGHERALESYSDSHVFYYPLDFSWAVSRVFERIRPAMVVLMEMEVWPNFISRACARGVPVVVASGRITERAHRGYARFPRLVQKMLSKVDLYLMQNELYADRLRSLGVPREKVRVVGNVKFDTVSIDVDPSSRRALRSEMGVGENEILIIGGSTHAGEEQALLASYSHLRRRDPRLRLLVVPRHQTRFEEVRRLIVSQGFEVFARSSLAGGAPAGGEVLLGDTMGELERLYEAADIAFVGGSLIPHGGQNILEPAAKGKPVVFGPSMENFPSAEELLLTAGAAVRIEGAGELGEALAGFLDGHKAAAAGEAGRAAVVGSKGATARTVEAITSILNEKKQCT